jgi:lipopolysaccharide/colanic/teichoic acid biosynthesis glycosyltransferase
MATKDLSLLDYHWVYKFDPDKSMLREGDYLFIKRVMDLVFVTLSMPFWLPMIGILALLIKLLEPGAPVFFIQTRTGKNGKRFHMLKFRTMVPNAETLIDKYRHLNHLVWPDFKIPNDPRVTKFGKFLRKTSLDELPQLINILKGDMSLVGPRPTGFSTDAYHLWHTQRLDVLPGLTGLWQITGRAETAFDDRVRLDIAYIDRRCLSLDMYILFKTIKALLLEKGAY